MAPWLALIRPATFTFNEAPFGASSCCLHLLAAILVIARQSVSPGWAADTGAARLFSYPGKAEFYVRLWSWKIFRCSPNFPQLLIIISTLSGFADGRWRASIAIMMSLSRY
jgi:hypothetical protein